MRLFLYNVVFFHILSSCLDQLRSKPACLFDKCISWHAQEAFSCTQLFSLFQSIFPWMIMSVCVVASACDHGHVEFTGHVCNHGNQLRHPHSAQFRYCWYLKCVITTIGSPSPCPFFIAPVPSLRALVAAIVILMGIASILGHAEAVGVVRRAILSPHRAVDPAPSLTGGKLKRFEALGIGLLVQSDTPVLKFVFLISIWPVLILRPVFIWVMCSHLKQCFIIHLLVSRLTSSSLVPCLRCLAGCTPICSLFHLFELLLEFSLSWSSGISGSHLVNILRVSLVLGMFVEEWLWILRGVCLHFASRSLYVHIVSVLADHPRRIQAGVERHLGWRHTV